MFTVRASLRSLVSVLATAVLVTVGVVVPAIPAAAAAAPVVAVATTYSGSGYYVAAADGTVVAVGSTHRGDRGGRSAAPVVDIATSANGYRLVDAAGGVTAHGRATHLGDLTGTPLNAPVVAIVPTLDDDGYWLVAADGGVFSFGRARFLGSMGGIALQAPVVDAAAAPSGSGYWLVAADGGVFSFGSARFLGSMGGIALQAPVTGITVSDQSWGYLLVASDGGTFAFGSMDFAGSLAGTGTSDIIDASAHRSSPGYLVLRGNGTAVDLVPSGPPTSTPLPGGNPPPTTPVADPPPADEPGPTLNPIETDLLRRINAERRQRGIAAVQADTALSAEAAAWVFTLPDSFRHSDLQSTLRRLGGRFNQLGENLYWGSGSWADAGSAHVSLMQSAGHRNTLLSPAYTSVGLAAVCIGARLYVVELFGRISSAGDGMLAPHQSRSPVAAPGTGGPSC